MYPEEPEDFRPSAETVRPEPKPKPSLAPSWVMLGFAVGALFVWKLPSKKTPEPVPDLSPREVSAPVAPQIAVVEAVFSEWGRLAVWENDVTEVALWNTETKGFSDCFEVLRNGPATYFRSIPKLTRPTLNRGVPENSPLQFTETEAQRSDRLGEKREETWRALSESARAPSRAP